MRELFRYPIRADENRCQSRRETHFADPFLIEEQRDKHHINADLRLLIEVVARDLKPGKLRLMYEANPMAFIVEQAGGMATDGLMRILDIVPTSLHQRVPVFLGSKNEIERVTQYHHAAAQD